MINLVLFGPPGAGKGTQSQRIIDEFGLVHMSTGDLLRAERKAGTPLGLKANEYIEKGALVPDEVVIGMIENALKSYSEPKGFIFDGFPRTVPQAQALDELLLSLSTFISCMIALEVPQYELEARLLNRGKDSGRADDQDIQIIRNRIRVYNEETLPVARYYTNQKKFHGINGVGTVDDIFTAIRTILKQYT